jgi:hypothetical protein
VRNAIANILDKYTLADIVEVTLRKMRRDKITLPFQEVTDEIMAISGLVAGRSGSARRAGRHSGRSLP